MRFKDILDLSICKTVLGLGSAAMEAEEHPQSARASEETELCLVCGYPVEQQACEHCSTWGKR